LIVCRHIPMNKSDLASSQWGGLESLRNHRSPLISVFAPRCECVRVSSSGIKVHQFGVFLFLKFSGVPVQKLNPPQPSPNFSCKETEFFLLKRSLRMVARDRFLFFYNRGEKSPGVI